MSWQSREQKLLISSKNLNREKEGQSIETPRGADSREQPEKDSFDLMCSKIVWKMLSQSWFLLSIFLNDVCMTSMMIPHVHDGTSYWEVIFSS